MPRLRLKGFYYALGRKKFFEFIIFSVFLIFFYLPLVNLVMLAFSKDYLYPKFVPSALSLDWWQFVLSQNDISNAIILSFIVAFTTVIVSSIICLPAAYAFARYKFPFRKFFLFSFLLTNAFPKTGLYVSICILFYKMNLMNTFPGVVIIHLINVMLFMTWIPAGAFSNIHREQEEAARDVGASKIQTFFKITFPLAIPGILVAMIFSFLSSLSEVEGTLLVGIPSFKTLPIMMYNIVDSYPATAGAVFAIILVIPVVLLLLIIRKFMGFGALADGFSVK